MTIIAPWLTAPETQAVFACLEKAGHEVRAVGGAVRNTLAGLPVVDVDLATTATPDLTTAAAQAAGLKAVPTGFDHGTITVVSGAKAFEVTTLRRDVSTDGRRAVVAFTDDFRQDAARRDFTINAIYADRTGNLFDPVGGAADLQADRVRFIGHSATRIREDYLRILRFFRFSSTFANGALDDAGLEACIENADGLATLSAERVASELLRIMETPSAAAVAKSIGSGGFLTPLFSGLSPISNPQALSRLIVIETDLGVPPSAERRLATWLLTSQDKAEWLAALLKLSRAQTQRVVGAMSRPARQDVLPPHDANSVRRTLYRYGRVAATDALLSAWAGGNLHVRDQQLTDAFQQLQATPVPTLPIGGADFIARGHEAGPDVGRRLRAFEQQWLDAGCPTDPAWIEATLKRLAEG